METATIFQLFGGLLFSVVGFYLIKNAKRRGNLAWVFIGIALLAFGYFIHNPWAVWGVGASLCGFAYFVRT